MQKPSAVTPDAPTAIPMPLLTQEWLDLAFIHWAVEPAAVAGLMPYGTVPDTYDGLTCAGLVAFRMHRVGWLRLRGIPYPGSFPETNVRLCGVDAHGRRVVVFRSMDASRLIPVLMGRAGFRLPCLWSRMSVRSAGETVTCTSSRRWPGPRGARSRITVRPGDRIHEPSDPEHFLTARWGMHNAFFGGPAFPPNHHPGWSLHRAEIVTCDEDLITSAGFPAPTGDPVSVLHSPGVPVRLGRPACPARPARPARSGATSAGRTDVP